MDKTSCKSLLGPLVQALKDTEKKKALIVLLILLVGVGVMGIILRTSLWIVLVGLLISVIVFLLILPLAKNSIIWAMVAMIPTLYGGFLTAEQKQKESKKDSNVKQYELVRYEKTTNTYELPDGRVYRMEKVKADLIRTGVENSYNPVDIHYRMPYTLLSINDDNILDCLQEYNRILDLYERDSIHFEVTPEYIFDELLHHQGYDREELKQKSKEELFRMWEKSEDAPRVYDGYHNHYKYLIQVAYFNRGALLDQLGQPERALEDYAHLDDSPDEEILYKNRALAYFHLGEYDKALYCLDEGLGVVRFDFSRYALYKTKGYILMELNDLEGAISCLKKAVEEIDYRAEGYNCLGLAYCKNGDYEKAIEAFGKAIAICTEEIEEDESRGVDAVWRYKRVAPYYYNRALAFRSIGRNKLARADERMVKKINKMEE